MSPPADPAELVRQLGSDRYAVRQRAESELVRLGVAAFDVLKAAESDHDPEIASRAAYLSQLIPIDWVEETDSSQAKAILKGYGSLGEQNRLKQVQALGTLAGDAGLEALCRVVRFEAAELVSRQAAVVLLETAPPARSEHDRWTAVVDRRLGQSQRVAANWLRAEADSWRDPAAALESWERLIRAERLAESGPPRPSGARPLPLLLRRQVQLLKRLDRHEEAVAAMRMMVDVEPGDPYTLARLLEWLIDERAWTVIDELEQRFAGPLREQPILFYMLAEASQAEGKQQAAGQLAEQAFQLAGDRVEKHLESAIGLERRGLADWSEREYRHVIETDPPESQNALFAGVRLSSMLHDREQYLPAARVLEAMFQALDRLAERPQPGRQGPQQPQRPPARRQPGRDMLRARMEYLFALHYRHEGDRVKQKEHLEQAIAYDPTEPDVLIEMYQLGKEDKEYAEKARRLIHAAVETFRALIGKDPSNHDSYNQLAWLVCNTEGDQDEALKLSQKSLELQPGLAGYMDTLAHCYFAKGDYANAVRMQKQAVKLEPHTQVIARKLAVFQRALEQSTRAPQP